LIASKTDEVLLIPFFMRALPCENSLLFLLNGFLVEIVYVIRWFFANKKAALRQLLVSINLGVMLGQLPLFLCFAIEE
jgi:hypothetical protein